MITSTGTPVCGGSVHHRAEAVLGGGLFTHASQEEVETTGIRSHESLSHPSPNVDGSSLVQASCMHRTVGSWVQWVCHGQKTVCHSPPLRRLALTFWLGNSHRKVSFWSQFWRWGIQDGAAVSSEHLWSLRHEKWAGTRGDKSSE